MKKAAGKSIHVGALCEEEYTARIACCHYACSQTRLQLIPNDCRNHRKTSEVRTEVTKEALRLLVPAHLSELESATPHMDAVHDEATERSIYVTHMRWPFRDLLRMTAYTSCLEAFCYASRTV